MFEDYANRLALYANQLLSNPFQLLVLIYFFYTLWQRFQPIPEEPGGPSKIKDLSEWNVIQKENNDKMIIVDYFATWCGPCRSSAPLYHKLSNEPEYENVIFLKCDVDAAADVAQAHQITSMPTFKIYYPGGRVTSLSGYNESKIRAAIDEGKKGN
jgi:thiol-disulfide isomerase/thioredoxin